MRNKSDKLTKRKKAAAAMLLMTVLFVGSLVCAELKVKRYLGEMAEYYCRAELSRSVNEAVREVMQETGAVYSDISADIFDENGKFVSSEICARNVNIIQSMTVQRINDKIAGLSGAVIEVPAGTLSGSFLLNGRGPEIRFRLVPVGSASAEIESDFESAGINQVCHKISLGINAEIRTVCPYGSSIVNCRESCLIAERVVSGDVPQFGLFS